ncbi:RagB/SusD family nutrient uptake outer membrane protein [Sphingobacterium sp. DN00404]|uniref:RagB/SusD family nutrient uptake outer membrane protein n=1 Tax=Sphingobacterium micropteri TaxID=2763501 RepID=A0ABR7YLP3_9SPHI|nr:RagB/SusD family nutrient uptake outer membrane protein [Sphingobacterium micropteri]MBD1432184.1 RagB/SusD family nutrient uptake outer membrane protein [Sphingobacterium micropteri]
MKIYKHTKLCSVLALLSLGVASCSDSFLNEKPYSDYEAGTGDPSIVENQLIGLHYIYAQLWGWSGRQGFLSCWQIGMDITSAGATEGVENPFYQYADLNSENGGVSYLWERSYQFINNANTIISSVGDENPAAAAEARFFRAYAYNTLVTLWGDVPLLTESIDIPTFNYTRASVADVDIVIEEDLDYAVANLPNVGETRTGSRINKDVARQLAAEAYLRMGERDASYFEKAEQMASAIIDGGKYQLIEARYGKYLGEGGDYYRDMFRQGNMRRSEGNTEAIWTFELEYNREVNGGTIDNPQHRRVWQPAYHKWEGMVNADSLGGRGNGRLRLSNFMKYTVWQGLEGDIRNSNYNIRRTVNYNRPGYSAEIGIDADGWRVAKDAGVQNVTIKTGDQAIPFKTDSLEVWYPFPTKWGGYDETDDFGYALVKDWSVMRLGETYLLRAEAKLRQGNTGGAADDINVLRDRAFKMAREESGNANLGQVSAADITLDFILDERARELISEENRRMTLVRTGKLRERIALNGDDGPSNKITSGFQDYHALLPIPLSEIQLNNKEGEPLTQNPGYSK